MNKNIRNRFSDVPKADRISPVTGESLAQQHMKDETDINVITNRYLKTGILGSGSGTRQPMFGDYTGIDYMEMQNAIADIDMSFMSLSSKIRSKFQNNPRHLLRWLEDPANHDEAVKLGLMPEPEQEVPETNRYDEAKAAGIVPLEPSKNPDIPA